ncbi:unnamed protein product [Caenorhabditis sp. 36 PRJEB53466]|nr:unnamed protein product [Caenorhabditis sp. 36 PRJEB53466]
MTTNSKRSSETSKAITGKTDQWTRLAGQKRKVLYVNGDCPARGMGYLTWLNLFHAVLFIFLITITVKQYFSFQKTVNLNIGMDESNFPSITFCNANPYKLSAVQAIPELEALLTVYSQALQ